MSERSPPAGQGDQGGDVPFRGGWPERRGRRGRRRPRRGQATRTRSMSRSWYRPNMSDSADHPRVTQVDGCYAAELGDCSGCLSGEHWISAAMLKLLAEPAGVSVRGAPWLNGKVRAVPVRKLKAKILCKGHNERLSWLDEFAAKVTLWPRGVREHGPRRRRRTGLEAAFTLATHPLWPRRLRPRRWSVHQEDGPSWYWTISRRYRVRGPSGTSRRHG
jgi:hypothetical protein